MKSQDWPHDRQALVDDLWALALAHLPEIPATEAEVSSLAALSGRALEPWQAQYTLIPDHLGAVIDDAYLYRFATDDYLLVVNASNCERDWIHLREQLKQLSRATLHDVTQPLAMLAFQGPLSKQLFARQIEGGSLGEPFRNRLSEVTFCGTKVLVARTGYTGEPLGFELFLPSDKAEDIWAMPACQRVNGESTAHAARQRARPARLPSCPDRSATVANLLHKFDS